VVICNPPFSVLDFARFQSKADTEVTAFRLTPNWNTISTIRATTAV
jgi:hypothetical protein